MTDPVVPTLKREYLDMLPEFHGQQELLPRFIEIAEKLVNKFYNALDTSDFQNEYLMASIFSKIKGEAAINISSSIITCWKDLKEALLNTYADKRDIYTLNIEMTELRQTTENAFDFYNKIQTCLNLQIAYISAHSTAAEGAILSQYIRNLALRVLLRGLRDPIGSLMRTKNPADMNSALNMLTNDFQIENKVFKKPQPINKPNFIRPSNMRQNFNAPLPLTNFAHNSQNQYNKPNNFSNNYRGQNPNTSRFQNNFRPNQTQNSFRPNQNQTFPKPTPMSVSTRNTFNPSANNTSTPNPVRNYRQNHNSNPTFIAEELFNIEESQTEFADNDGENFDDNLGYTPENEEFFQEIASEQEFQDSI